MDLARKGGPLATCRKLSKLKVRRLDTLLVNIDPLSVSHESDLS
jgi:hypothetical protein